MSRAAGGLTKLERLVPVLEQLGGVRLRVWRVDGPAPRLVAGAAASWTPTLPKGLDGTGRPIETPEGDAWFEPVRTPPGFWVEMRNGPDASGRTRPPVGDQVVEAVTCLAEAEREAAQVAAELSDR